MIERILRTTAARLARRLHGIGDRVDRLADRPSDPDLLAPTGEVEQVPPPPGPPRPDFATSRRHEDIEWFHSIELGDGIVTHGVKSLIDLEGEFASLQLDRPQLDGRTVLDVGTADGWNALRCEKLGASVTAVDAIHREGLRYVRGRLTPRFRFVQMDISGPSFLELGQFDVVLYLGVIYHTPYSYEQLVRVSGRCKDTLLLESAYLNLPGSEHEPTLTFNFDGHITRDLSSPVFPSVTWIRQSLSRIGFRQVELLQGGEARFGRVVVRARDRDPNAVPILFAAEQVHV
jgi:tRNA (mo5U34)-methyltransferase